MRPAIQTAGACLPPAPPLQAEREGWEPWVSAPLSPVQPGLRPLSSFPSHPESSPSPASHLGYCRASWPPTAVLRRAPSPFSCLPAPRPCWRAQGRYWYFPLCMASGPVDPSNPSRACLVVVLLRRCSHAAFPPLSVLGVLTELCGCYHSQLGAFLYLKKTLCLGCRPPLVTLRPPPRRPPVPGGPTSISGVCLFRTFHQSGPPGLLGLAPLTRPGACGARCGGAGPCSAPS